ncbi:MAG TPA: hypothetical protein VGX78_11135 [Pirellulales bacterium]|nr:hypothetical protein [Pirellulales bacterium]
MSIMQVVVQGVLKSDGTLELDEQPTLPPGRVEVTVTSLQPKATTYEEKMGVLKSIWAEQDRLGMVPRTAAQVDADIREMREEWEDRQLELDRLIDQGSQQRKPPC